MNRHRTSLHLCASASMAARHLWLPGLLVGVALCVPVGALAKPISVQLKRASPAATAGQPVALRVNSRGAKQCTLSYSGPRRGRGGPLKLRGLSGKEQQITWVVARDVRLGQWTLKISCRNRSRASLRLRVASDRIRQGKKLIKPGSLRVRSLSSPPRADVGQIDEPGDGLGKGAGNGGYAYGWCTYYAWTRRTDLNNLGNAGDWKANAERRAISTGPANAPVAGAIAWWSSSNPSTSFIEDGRRVNYGHVAYVEQVRDNQFLVSEMNWPTWNVVSQRWITPGGRGAPDGFIYGGPAGNPPPGGTPGGTGPGGGTDPGALARPGRLLQIVKEPDPAPWASFDISTGVQTQGSPSVVWGDTVNVFAIRSDGALGQWSIVPGQAGWSISVLSEAGLLRGGVSAVRIGDTFQVFASGADGRLWQFVKEPAQPWAKFDISTGVLIKGSPAVVFDGIFNVFGARQDGSLGQWSITPGQTSWSTYQIFGAGLLTGGVDAERIGNTFQLFAGAADGRLLQIVKQPNPAPWQHFDISTGVKVKGTPALVWGETVNVFGAREDGSLGQWSIVPGQTSWSTYQILSPGLLQGGVGAVRIGNTFQLFGSSAG